MLCINDFGLPYKKWNHTTSVFIGARVNISVV